MLLAGLSTGPGLVAGCGAQGDSPAPATPCAVDQGIADDGTCTTPGVPTDGCAPGFSPSDHGCRAELPTCAAGTIAVLGEATCHPVGPTCAEGFTADGDGGCAAVLPATACGPGELAVPGAKTCAPVDGCSDTPADEKGLWFVDPAAATGGDGSKAKPFATVGAALAAATAGDRLFLADGAYPGPLVVDKAVSVFGRCAAKAVVTGTASDQPVVQLGDGASLAHVAVTGKGVAGVDLSGKVTIEALWVHDVEGSGVRALGAAGDVVAKRLLVDAATAFGVEVVGGKVDLRESVVRNTRPRGDGQRGIGLSVERPSFGGSVTTVTATLVVLEHNADNGILAHGSKVTVRRSVIRDTEPRADGTFGIGLYALAYSDSKAPAGDVLVEDSLLASNTYAGVQSAGAVVTLDRVTVRDTRPQTDARKIGGRGVIVMDHPVAKQPGVLTLRSSAVLRSREVGVLAASSTLTVEDSLVRDTKKGADELLGGIAGVASTTAKAQATVTVRRSLVEANDMFGVYAHGTKLSLEGSTVRKTRATTADTGWGVHALFDATRRVPAELAVTGCVFEDNVQYAIFAADAPASVTGTLVRHQRLGPADVGAGAAILSRVSDLALGKVTRVEATVVEDVQELGFFFDGAQAEVDRVTVRDLVPGPARYAVGAVVYAYPQLDGTTTGGIASFRRSSFTGLAGSGLMFGNADVDLEDSLVRNVAAVPEFGDALTLEPKGGGSKVRLRRCTILDAARAGAFVVGSDLTLSGNRLCGKFPLAAQSGVEPPTLHDEGHNVCGCPTAEPCVVAETKLEPLTLRK